MHVESQQVRKDDRFKGFERIVKPLELHLNALNSFLEAQIELFEPELRDLVRYCLAHKGKRIRPMLVFYSGWKGEDVVSADLVKVAGLIELSHLATLVHDDILDEATIRHNSSTISNKYGSQVAVLLGDALFAHSLILASEFKSGDVCYTIAQSIRRVCAGEIQQTFQSNRDDHSFEDYYRIIDLKTAELFYASCLLGARLGGFSKEYIEVVSAFGRDIGIAYQIYDDLVDILGSETNIGKTLGTDFAKGKHTLPVLKLMEKLSPIDQQKFLRDVKNSKITLEELKRMLDKYGVFAEVLEILNKKIKDAGLSIANFKSAPSFPYLCGIQDLVLDQVERLQKVHLF